MASDESVLGRLKARGEEMFGKVTSELMANPNFMKALQAGLLAKEKLDKAVAKALKSMNVPTRVEFKRAVARIEDLERQIEGLQQAVKARPAAAPKPARPAARKATRRKAATKAAKAPAPTEPAE
jgi:hypothetical protein